MKELTYIKRVDGVDVVFSSDCKYLREYKDIGPSVQVLSTTGDNEWENLTKYAIMADDLEEIKKIATDDYCRKIIVRYYNESLLIKKTSRLYIKEIAINDVSDLEEIYRNAPFIEKFFDSENEILQIIRKYIDEVYCFYDFGIWGIYMQGTDKMIGIVGFTPRESIDCGRGLRDNQVRIPKFSNENNTCINIVASPNNNEDMMDLELGYAINPKYRGKRYAYEACLGAINFAIENIEFNSIYVNADNNNIAAIGLANKLAEMYMTK